MGRGLICVALLVLAPACDREKVSTGRGATPASSAEADDVATLRCVAGSAAEPMSCIAYEGRAWESVRASIEDSCTRGAARFEQGACPDAPSWGTCVREGPRGAKARHRIYRRRGPVQGGDVTSEAEAKEIACRDGTWITDPAAKALPPASALPAEPPPRARPTVAGICDDTGKLMPGALRAARIDLHAYVRMASALFPTDFVVTGEATDPEGDACTGPCLSLDARVTSFDDAMKIAGAPFVRRGTTVLVGPSFTAARPSVLALALPPVDLELSRIETDGLVRLLAGVAKREIRGMPQGIVSIQVKNRPASDVVTWLAEAAGTRVTVDGAALSVAPGGSLPPAVPTGHATAPLPVEGRPEPAFRNYRVAAVGVSAGGRPVAAIASKEVAELTFLVAPGEPIVAPRVAPDSVATRSVSTIVQAIDCDGVVGVDGVRLALH